MPLKNLRTETACIGKLNRDSRHFQALHKSRSGVQADMVVLPEVLASFVLRALCDFSATLAFVYHQDSKSTKVMFRAVFLFVLPLWWHTRIASGSQAHSVPAG